PDSWDRGPWVRQWAPGPPVVGSPRGSLPGGPCRPRPPRRREGCSGVPLAVARGRRGDGRGGGARADSGPAYVAHGRSSPSPSPRVSGSRARPRRGRVFRRRSGVPAWATVRPSDARATSASAGGGRGRRRGGGGRGPGRAGGGGGGGGVARAVPDGRSVSGWGTSPRT